MADTNIAVKLDLKRVTHAPHAAGAPGAPVAYMENRDPRASSAKVRLIR